MKAVPLADKSVLNPETKKPLEAKGEIVSPDYHSYWLRRRDDGDVRLVDDAASVTAPSEWDRMLESAAAMKADAKAKDEQAKALRESAKALDEEAKALRSQADQKERAAKAALDGGKAS